MQEITGLATGTQHVVVEPPTLEVLDADRGTPADGQSLLPLQITPRDLDGSVKLGAAVEVELLGGGAVFAADPIVEDGVWSASVRAPAVEGSTRVVATIDGVELRVRPRLWWGAAN